MGFKLVFLENVAIPLVDADPLSLQGQCITVQCASEEFTIESVSCSSYSLKADDSVEAHSCVCRYNMKLMSNTAASYQMGAGRFKPWLFVNCYRSSRQRAILLLFSSIAHQFHVVA